MKARVLSLNAGLLKLFGWSLPVPFVPERLTALPGELRKTPCDLLLLQEVYGHTNRRWLADSVQDILPFAVYPRTKRNFGLENGLMVLSRYPATGEIELFTDAPSDEALFDSKGMLVTRHRLSDAVSLNAINIHTTAGGMFHHPEHRKTDEIRSRQVAQVLARARGLESPLIVGGDLNAGPGVSEGNFRQMLEAGFVSLYDAVGDGIEDATWHPKNPLNSNGPHKECPPQRIDHVFVRQEDLSQNRLKALSSQICLRDAVVPIGGAEAVSISDHFGVFVEIEIVSELQPITTVHPFDRERPAP